MNDGINITGTTQRVGNRLFLIVSGNTVREYTIVFYEREGATLTLFGYSGDGNTYFQGPFAKQ